MAIDIRQVCKRYAEEFWGNGNVSTLEQVCDTKRYKLHEPLEGVLDFEGTKRNLETFHKAFTNFRTTTHDMIVEGNNAAMYWTFSGDFQNPLYGIRPNGKTVTVTGMTLLRFDGEKLVEEVQQYDSYGMFRAMGVVPRIEDLATHTVQPQP